MICSVYFFVANFIAIAIVIAIAVTVLITIIIVIASYDNYHLPFSINYIFSCMEDD